MGGVFSPKECEMGRVTNYWDKVNAELEAAWERCEPMSEWKGLYLPDMMDRKFAKIIATCGHELESMNDGVSQERGDCNNPDGTYFGFYCKKCAKEYDEEMGKIIPNKVTGCDVKPQTWEDAAQIIAREIAELLARKQHDYGPNNILGFGEKGIAVRMWDKVNRLKNLLWDRDEAGQEESIGDTFVDLAGYSIIALMLRRGWFTLPLKEDKK